VGVGIERENTIEGVCRRPLQETFHFGKEAVGLGVKLERCAFMCI